jgi:hypothetical protein
MKIINVQKKFLLVSLILLASVQPSFAQRIPARQTSPAADSSYQRIYPFSIKVNIKKKRYNDN